MDKFVDDESFEKIDFAAKELPKAEYDSCTFNGCNLSNIKTNKTVFRDVKFSDSKMMGIHFDHCSDFLFSVSFDTCILHFSSFYGMKLKKTPFKNSSFKEVDFTDADLSSADFALSDLQSAKFENSNLEKADFRQAFNYSINPSKNKIRKARFSTEGLPGLLEEFDIEIE